MTLDEWDEKVCTFIDRASRWEDEGMGRIDTIIRCTLVLTATLLYVFLGAWFAGVAILITYTAYLLYLLCMLSQVPASYFYPTAPLLEDALLDQVCEEPVLYSRELNDIFGRFKPAVIKKLQNKWVTYEIVQFTDRLSNLPDDIPQHLKESCLAIGQLIQTYDYTKPEEHVRTVERMRAWRYEYEEWLNTHFPDDA